MQIKNALYIANVMHKRLLPRINQFVYKSFYFCAQIDDLKLAKSCFFSFNKFNLFSFYNRDYGLRTEENPQIWVEKILRENGVKNVDKIFLITHPRILGYAFNPVNFWFCLNEEGALQAVLAEVNNTFGESHSYLIFEENGEKIDENKFYQAQKEFHVSPFMKREGFYKFRFVFNEKNIAIWIDFFNEKSEKMLVTSLIGKRFALNEVALLRCFVIMPFITFKVIFLIHYQAVKLLLKKVKYIKKPTQLKSKITKVK